MPQALGEGYSLYSPPPRPLYSFSPLPTLGGVINGLVTLLFAGWCNRRLRVMRGPLAGLGDSAAARAIHREASPGLRLRTKTHGPLQTPSSRYQNPLRLRVSPRSIPLTHTHKNPSGVSTTQPRTPSTHTPSHCPMLPRARECLGHKTRASTHTYVMSARARVGGSRPAVLPVASPSVAPAHPAPLTLTWR